MLYDGHKSHHSVHKPFCAFKKGPCVAPNKRRRLCPLSRLENSDAVCQGSQHLSKSKTVLSRHLAQLAQTRATVTDRDLEAQQDVRNLNSNGSAQHSSQAFTFSPEDFTLEPGVPSTIQRDTPLHLDDVFRCPRCLEEGSQDEQGCNHMSWRHSSSGYMREILNAKVYDVAVESPLELAKQLSAKYKNSIYLKREDTQPVFSFKLRGAYNKMASLSSEQRAKGVITSSAGNHAQGVALAAKRLGCQATICMPVVAPDIKVQAVRRLGGIVELAGETYTETQTYAQEKSRREGMVFIPPYDDPYVIAGQGTVGAEILRQLSSLEKENLEAVFISIGGGGLAAGVAAYIKNLLPGVKVFGVEPTGANCMTISLEKGRRVTLSKVDAFADGVAVKTVGSETFRLCRELLDGVLLVDNQSISGAIESVFNDKRSILEPAGAVAVAGATQYLEKHNLQGKAVVAITSGANMNFDRLRLVADLAAVGARQEAIFVTTIPEQLGSFQNFMDVALADTGIQITEFKYRYSAAENAHILWGADVQSSQAADELVTRLNAKGLQTQDASSIEAVQIHLRHLVGGRARSYMGSLPNERILQVAFPERPGALRDFLSVIVPHWNLTLFHYRKSGNRQTPLLLGIQIPAGTEQAFSEAQRALGEDFTFTELSDAARDIFDKFIS